MINSTPAESAFIHVCIAGLGAIAPVSVACTVYAAILPYIIDTRWPLPALPLPLRLYCGVEALFLLCFQLPLYYTLQKDAAHPPLLPTQARHQLFARITHNVTPADLARHIRGWFRGAELVEIGREGVKDWLAWAFFEGRIGGAGADDELEAYTQRVERLLGHSFAKGYGCAKPIRLTLDRIELHGWRSLAWYFCVAFVDFLAYVQLCRHGYHHHRLAMRSFGGLFPFRPVALTARQTSPVQHLTYWHRPHTATNRHPVVFIHGIGIGLYPYVNPDDLIQHVDDGHQDSRDGHIGILALEIMPVAFRVTHASLSKEDMCREISTILAHHGFDKFVLIGHSYGTVIATHMLHDPVLQSKAASVLLIDPVCFLLHNPDVAYNFTVRRPKAANEWQLWYFASQDLGVAHTLGRRFFWSENVLWLDDLLPLMEATGMRVTVSLAGRDLIVNTEEVGKYLTGEGEYLTGGKGQDDDWKAREWTGEGLEVIWNEDRDHAQVFDSKSKRAKLVRVVRKYCEADAAV